MPPSLKYSYKVGNCARHKGDNSKSEKSRNMMAIFDMCGRGSTENVTCNPREIRMISPLCLHLLVQIKAL